MVESSVQQMDVVECFLADETKTQAFAQKMASVLADERLWRQGVVIYLQGDLGAGKSFLARHFIQAFAPEQKVKSPTYTLVESYLLKFETEAFSVHHFDLYRLCDPEELGFLGVRDLFVPPFIAFIEWPKKGGSLTPEADWELCLQAVEKGGKVGRQLRLEAATQVGRQGLERFHFV